MAKLLIDIDEERKSKFKAAAFMNEISMRQLILRYVDSYIKENEGLFKTRL